MCLASLETAVGKVQLSAGKGQYMPKTAGQVVIAMEELTLGTSTGRFYI